MPAAPEMAANPDDAALAFKAQTHIDSMPDAYQKGSGNGPSYKDQLHSARGCRPAVASSRAGAPSVTSFSSRDTFSLRGVDPPPMGSHLPAFRDQERTPGVLLNKHPAASSPPPDTASRQPSSSTVKHVQATGNHLNQDHTSSTEKEDEEPAFVSESMVKNHVEAELFEQNNSNGIASDTRIYQAEALVNAVILKRRRFILAVVAVLVLIGVILGGVCGSGKCDRASAVSDPSVSSPAPPGCTKERPLLAVNTTTDRYVRLKRIFSRHYDDDILSDEGEGNPRFRALHWVANEDPLQLGFNSSNFQPIWQRYVLVLFYFSTKGWCWELTTNWLTGKEVCRWDTVSCVDGTVMVEVIGARGNNVNGTLPSELGDLDQLTYLDLANNPLSGIIPSQLGKLPNVRNLSFGSGAGQKQGRITGTLPTELGRLSTLEFFAITANQVTGTIPEEFGNLQSMTELYLSENQLTGTVPESVLNLPLLKTMYLHDNLLVGDFDMSICDPKSPFQFRSDLSFLDVGSDCNTTNEVMCSCCSFCCDPDECCDLTDTQTGNRICSPRS